MVSRNQLLGQMQRPRSAEENIAELNTLRRGMPHLTTKQKIRFDELEKWYAEYRREIEEQFRHWVFHPNGAEKVAESREEFEKALSDGWYATRDERKAAEEDSKTAKGRQEIIEREFQEEKEEQKVEDKADRQKYLMFLKRIISRNTTEKTLYYYTMQELSEVYKRLNLDLDESMNRVAAYKHLKNYIELNT